MGYIRAVCISEKKGTGKKNVGEAVFIEDEGLKGDAHAGKWHRQVSLLSKEAVEAFKKRGASVEDGDFGENLLVEGFELQKSSRGNDFFLQRCGSGVDPDRKRVPFPLCHP